MFVVVGCSGMQCMCVIPIPEHYAHYVRRAKCAVHACAMCSVSCPCAAVWFAVVCVIVCAVFALCHCQCALTRPWSLCVLYCQRYVESSECACAGVDMWCSWPACIACMTGVLYVASMHRSPLLLTTKL